MVDRISAVPRQARPYQGQGAGLVTRAIASSVDALTVGAALVVGYVGINAVTFLARPTGFQVVSASPIFSLATALVISVAYFTVAWSATGRSYGNHVMGLRVVDRRGQRLRVPRALVRAMCCVAFPIGLLWCASNASRRSLQDRLLGTSVIYDWTPRREAQTAPRSG